MTNKVKYIAIKDIVTPVCSSYETDGVSALDPFEAFPSSQLLAKIR